MNLQWNEKIYADDLLPFWMMLNIASGHDLKERAPRQTLTYSNSNWNMFKVNNKTPERLSTVFLLAFGIFYTFFIVSAVDFEQSTIKCSITNYCNNLQNCKKISEIETHERLS